MSDDARQSRRDRRAAYRVTPEAPDEIDLELLAARQRITPGRLADVAIGGARVELEDDDDTAIDLGARVNLALHCRQPACDARVSAVVVSREGGAVRSSIGVRFEDPGAVFDRDSHEIFRLFNRRAYRRHGPAADAHEFSATLSLADDRRTTWPVTISDISNVGVSLRGDARRHAALAGAKRFQLSLDLPGSPGRTTIACVVHYREVEGAQVRYGCEYDWAATPDCLRVAEDIAAYVLENLGSGSG